MSTLRELQRGVQAFVLGRDRAVAARVAGSDAGSAQERLDIYRHAVAMRFREVLAEDYTGVHVLLGDDAFTRLAREYAAAHPSRHPSIRWFGRHLPQFLRASAPWDAQAVLAQMAAFEWARSELVDAADADVVGIPAIAAVPPAQWGAMAPRTVPAVRRVVLDYNVPQLSQAIEHGDAPPPIARADAPREWLLWRKGVAIHWRSIEPDEAWALDACAAGTTFADLCAGLCDFAGEAAAPRAPPPCSSSGPATNSCARSRLPGAVGDNGVGPTYLSEKPGFWRFGAPTLGFWNGGTVGTVGSDQPI